MHALNGVVPRLLVFLYICLLSSPWIVLGADTFDVFRLIQLDRTDGNVTRIGSQRSSVNLPATTVNALGSLSRRIVILPFEVFDNATVTDTVLIRGAHAILVLIRSTSDALPGLALHQWDHFEKQLLQTALQIPIYFAHADPLLQQTYEYIMNHGNGAGSDSYQIAISAAQPSRITDGSYINIHGWLPSAQQGHGSYRKSLPTIALVAHYDTFSSIPGLSHGSDSDASGAVAILELARIFSKFYNTYDTPGRYNLVFVLTSASALRHAGVRKWLDERHGSGELDQVQFALCIDDLTADAPLAMHAPTSASDWSVVQRHIYESFNTTAQQLGVGLALHTRAPPEAESGHWAHEEFADRGLAAATLSTHALPPAPLSATHPSYLTAKNATRDGQLELRVRLVAEALSKVLYGLPHDAPPTLVQASHAVSSDFVAAWLDALAAVPRMVPYLRASSALIKSLDNAFGLYTLDHVRESYRLGAEELAFYEPIRATMTVSRVKPFVFELGVAVCVLAYLVGLFVALNGTDQAAAIVAAFIHGTTATPSALDRTKKKKI